MKKRPSNVVVNGAAGKMGIEIIKQIVVNQDLMLKSALDREENPLCGNDIRNLVGSNEFVIVRNFKENNNLDIAIGSPSTDVLIDFSSPESAMNAIELAGKSHKAVVVGTTGFNVNQLERIAALAKLIPIVQDYNFSIGICLLTKYAEQLAAALGIEFDVDIVEIHHRLKKDAPSGTAIKLAKAIAKGRQQDYTSVVRMSREGIIGERPVGEIGIQALRFGTVVGEHTVNFGGPYERIELTHKAVSRAVFAQGVIRSALWVVNKKPGLYTLRDVV